MRALVAAPDPERFLFRSVLEHLPQVTVIAETNDGRVALEYVRRWRFGLALLDIPLAHINGLTVARQALHVSPGIRVAIISAVDDPACLLEALRIGVNGYLSVTASIDDLAEAIQRILTGETLFDSVLSTRALQRMAAGCAR
ncbi:MAG: response regulator [Roseiflexaceae bacterium]|nr:response regulator [Roseiflexaceae bacterium]